MIFIMANNIIAVAGYSAIAYSNREMPTTKKTGDMED